MSVTPAILSGMTGQQTENVRASAPFVRWNPALGASIALHNKLRKPFFPHCSKKIVQPSISVLHSAKILCQTATNAAQKTQVSAHDETA
jgi:hypothetical protein